VIPLANLTLITVFPTSSFQDEASTDLMHRLRNETIPPVEQSTGLAVYTTGGPAFIVDFSDYMADRLPLFIGAVLLLSFLLLMVVFHSVVVPLKAVIMNMLSIGAAFGATVAVFQWGLGASLIGIGKEGPIEAWAPIMLFAIVFGLSMDYEVFLLSRVREEYDRTGDNRRAVADGLAATGRVISAAAAIMVCVRQLRARQRSRAEVVRLWAGRGGVDRRDHRAVGAGAGSDGADGQGQLVGAELARALPAHHPRRHRTHGCRRAAGGSSAMSGWSPERDPPSGGAGPGRGLPPHPPTGRERAMKVMFVAGFGPIVRDIDASRAFWGAGLGIALQEATPSYWTNDDLEGVKAFALWPLVQAAESCFGTATWPAEIPVPQAWMEVDVESPEAVGGAAVELEAAGHRLLRGAREEPWGQTTARLLSPEGLLIGVAYTPWMHRTDGDGAPADS
jgi:catechol 2,3-dioxygenase-like lactoylglutathione lyase family enzyme